MWAGGWGQGGAQGGPAPCMCSVAREWPPLSTLLPNPSPAPRGPYQRLHHRAAGHAADLAAPPRLHAVDERVEEARRKQIPRSRGVHHLSRVKGRRRVRGLGGALPG